MSKVEKKKRSLEFLTVFTAVVGTIIGVGIYVKNDNHQGHVLGDIGNPIVALILWTFVGLMVFMLMIFFLEITSSTLKSGNGTISNWIKLFIGRRTASMVSIYYIFVYLPVNYGFFATIIVSYILAAANNPIKDPGELVALYLIFGILFIVFFSMINAFLRDFSKLFQIVGTIVKLVPVFFVLLAIFIPDTTWGVFFNNDSQKVVDNSGGLTWSTSLSEVDGMKIFSGFAPILFAFNGFISAANLQSESKNKEMVGRAILIGVGFSAVFYILVTIALFLGSKDGSVVSFFEYMFNGFKSTAPGESAGVSTLMGNLVLAIVCLISINSYTLLGPSFLYNDAKNGIIFTNNKHITLVKSAMLQMILGIFFFIVLVLMGIFAPTSPGMPVSYYFDQTSNAGAIIGFTFYIFLLVGGIKNRKTNKVEVVKLKTWVFWTTAIFSLISLGFMLGYSYIDFFILSALPGPNQDLAKPVAMAASMIGVGVIWVWNEVMFHKVPFNFEEMNTTFPIPHRQKRFVWKEKVQTNSKIKRESANQEIKPNKQKNRW